MVPVPTTISNQAFTSLGMQTLIGLVLEAEVFASRVMERMTWVVVVAGISFVPSL